MKHWLLALFCAFACNSVSLAQPIVAAGAQSGKPKTATYSATVEVPADLVGQGFVWFAISHNGVIYFYGPDRGWVPYSDPATTPAMQAITSTRESFALSNWDISTVLGGQVWVGYGRSLGEMAVNGTFRMIGELTAPPERVYATATQLSCHNPYITIISYTVQFITTIVNDTSYPIARIDGDITLNVLGRPLPITARMNYTIPGGIAPGASMPLRLEPSILSTFYTDARPFCATANTTMDLRITSAVDGNGVTHNY